MKRILSPRMRNIWSTTFLPSRVTCLGGTPRLPRQMCGSRSWRSRRSAIRREVKAAHVCVMAVMYLCVTQRQMSRCFITLSVQRQDYNGTWK